MNKPRGRFPAGLIHSCEVDNPGAVNTSDLVGCRSGMSSHGVVDRSSQGHPSKGPHHMPGEKLYKPGQPAPVSSQVEIVGPRGGRTGTERTAVQGKPLPPTPQAGQRYRVADPTKNGAGRPKK